MKILQVIPTLDQGGAEHFVFELATAIHEKEIQCDVVTLYDVAHDNYMAAQLRSKGINIYSLGKKEGFDLSIYLKLLKLIKKNDYDVIHSHVGAIKYTLLASYVTKHVSFFATIHSEAKREAGKNIELWSRRLLFKTNKCIPVTISEESEKSFEDFYGFKTIMIPNGVSKFTPGNPVNIKDNFDQIVFIHPASCQPVKNQILLFEAFEKLAELYPNVKLIWAGTNEAYKDLFISLQEKMSSKICYVGTISNVRDYMYAADGMCLSSKMEGLPMTVIEAFSVGCIPLCTPVGGCNNIIRNGYNGFLSADLSVDSYCEMLKKFVQLNVEEKKRMKNNAIASYEDYSINSTCEKYLEVYKHQQK